MKTKEIVILAVVSVILASFIVAGSVEKSIRKSAIKADVGEFYIDKKNSISEFRWKTNTITVTNTVVVNVVGPSTITNFVNWTNKITIVNTITNTITKTNVQIRLEKIYYSQEPQPTNSKNSKRNR